VPFLGGWEEIKSFLFASYKQDIKKARKPLDYTGCVSLTSLTWPANHVLLFPLLRLTFVIRYGITKVPFFSPTITRDRLLLVFTFRTALKYVLTWPGVNISNFLLHR